MGMSRACAGRALKMSTMHLRISPCRATLVLPAIISAMEGTGSATFATNRVKRKETKEPAVGSHQAPPTSALNERHSMRGTKEQSRQHPPTPYRANRALRTGVTD